jgi:lipopolysaccharide/colanic/teichoic acid biosynthesis glycosyltransferase
MVMVRHSTGPGVRRWTPKFDGTDAARRVIDVALSTTALVCLLPLLVLIGIGVMLEGGLPIFYSQNRLGRHGRMFHLYKFRKFGKHVGAGLPLTLRDDPRLTPVGRLLERSKLDELPQFWNVLTGDMSIVGPRPESRTFADCFQGEHRALLDHKPGIFGPAQTQFRNESALYPPMQDPELVYREVLFPAKANIDLSYYPARTLLKDLSWIARGLISVGAGLSHHPPPQTLAHGRETVSPT